MGKYSWILLVLLLSAVNIWLFWPGSLYFLNDDFIHIPLSARHQLFQTNSPRPVHELLVNLDLALWNKSAWGYHITALLLHFMVTWQLFDLCMAMQQKWNAGAANTHRAAAYLAVTIFLVYPQHSEALAWILGRTPVLSAVFVMMVLRLYFISRFTTLHYFIGGLCFLIALFTYEQSILLPVLLFIAALSEKEKQLKNKALRFSVLMALVAGLYTITRKLITHQLVGNYEGANLVNLNIPKLAANFLRIISRIWINPADDFLVYLISAITIGVLLITSIYLFRSLHIEKRMFVFCTAIILLLALPVISLGISTHSFESGRFLYLPSIFLAILLGCIFTKAFQTIPARAMIVLSLLCCYWLAGKITAAAHYKEASAYSRKITGGIIQHFNTTADTLVIDTLQLSVHQLPVFRIGLKQGVQWLNENADTGRIVVNHSIDESFNR